MLKRVTVAKLLAREDVSHGDILRCLDTQGNLMFVGKVTDNGLCIPGKNEKPITLIQFEKLAAQLHPHPLACTVLPSGKTVEDCIDEINSEREKKRMAPPKSLLEDDHDDYCAYCGFGGNLLCCEACPVTMHAPCAGVSASDAEKEWFCPGCTCSVCHKALHVSHGCPRVYCGAADFDREASSCHEYNDILKESKRKRLRIKVEAQNDSKRRRLDDPHEGNVHLGAQLPETFLKNFDNMTNEIDAVEKKDVPWDSVKSPCGTRAHATCVKGLPARAEGNSAWYHGKEEQLLEKLVSFCSKGAMNVGTYGCGAVISFQIIHAAAASAVVAAHGIAPEYTDQQRVSLRKILSACRCILNDSYDEVWDSRTGIDLISMMLTGESKSPWVDFSGIFVGVLFVDSTVAAVCCFRLLGDTVAEIPVLTSRQEIRGCKSGMALLSKLEQCLHASGVQRIVMPAMYCPNHAYLPAFHPPGEPLPPPLQNKVGFNMAKAHVVSKILSHRGLILPGVPWVQKETSPLDWPKWRKACAHVHIKLADTIDICTFVDKGHILIAPEEDSQDQDDARQEQEMDTAITNTKIGCQLSETVVPPRTARSNRDLSVVQCFL